MNLTLLCDILKLVNSDSDVGIFNDPEVSFLVQTNDLS